MHDDRHRRRNAAQVIARAYQLSNEVLSACIAVALLVLGGRYLDGWLGTEPFLMVTGSVLGFGVLMLAVMRLSAKLRPSTSADSDESTPGSTEE